MSGWTVLLKTFALQNAVRVRAADVAAHRAEILRVGVQQIAVRDEIAVHVSVHARATFEGIRLVGFAKVTRLPVNAASR